MAKVSRGHHQHARLITATVLQLSVAILLLLAFHPNGVVSASNDVPSISNSAYADTNDANKDDNGYESKIEQVLSPSHHDVTESHQLVERPLQEGGVAAAIEIGTDGNMASSTSGSQEELRRVEFATQAVEREVKREVLNKIDEDDGSVDGDSVDVHDKYDCGDDEELRALIDAIKDEYDKRDVYEDILDEAETKAKLDRELWLEYGYWDLHAYFSCARIFAASRLVYDSETWADLRQYYHAFRKQDKEEMPISEGKPERTYQLTNDVFDPPMEPFQSGEKGRGLKAARDIHKGELVFQATNNTVVFTDGHTWSKFLFAIYERNGEPYDSETTCDILVWSWVQKVEEDGPLVIVADLDNGSLLNEGRDQPGWDKPNVRCGKEGDKSCMNDYYATKDIKEGDELLCDYRDFALFYAWSKLVGNGA